MESTKVEESINFEKLVKDVKQVYEESDAKGKDLIKLCLNDILLYKELKKEDVNEKLKEHKKLMVKHSEMLMEYFS